MRDDKNNETKRISLAVIRRLPRYYRYLGDLMDKGVSRISSKELSGKMNITASQIRQDLNNFGCFGQQGYGYNVESLYGEIKKILGLGRTYRMVVVGAGKIGQALINYGNFSRRGFEFVGIFDVNPEVVGAELGGMTVQDISQLDKFLSEGLVDIAVLTVPEVGVPDAMRILRNGNIKGIWNFTPVDLSVPENIVVENVHLTDSIMTLSYRINEEGILNGMTID